MYPCPAICRAKRATGPVTAVAKCVSNLRRTPFWLNRRRWWGKYLGAGGGGGTLVDFGEQDDGWETRCGMIRNFGMEEEDACNVRLW